MGLSRSSNRQVIESLNTQIQAQLINVTTQLTTIRDNIFNELPTIIASNSSAFDANIRNSKLSEPQIVRARSLFSLDSNLQGNFNNFPYEIWDKKTSKIKPSVTGKIFIARVSFNSNSSETIAFTIDLDVNGLVIYRHSFQPLQLTEGLLVETFTFFAGASFVQHGGTLNISASRDVAISNKSLYLIQLP